MYVLANMLLRHVRSSSDSLTKHPAGAPTKVGDHAATPPDCFKIIIASTTLYVIPGRWHGAEM